MLKFINNFKVLQLEQIVVNYIVFLKNFCCNYSNSVDTSLAKKI
jgi:hypothetical protein